ncbi:PP2C-like domain-containing protein CG9801 [Nilaparvata lugens]|uniref:PP2C-like domain-containing protein CG9801 n=1 Tax=Nilaparvata lugens TaxID=108931 RepID=UPI00193D8E9F|nr:PP2C-like domain-containing protein CG9801 [Nilaparvata lugens]
MMPSFKQKVVGFIRQLSNQSENNRNFEDQKPDQQSESFIKRYLSGEEVSKDEPKIVHGRFAQELPSLSLGVLSRPVLVAATGPEGGLTTVNRRQRHLSVSDPDVRFIDDTLLPPPALTGAQPFIGETSVADIGDSKPDTKVIPPPPEYAVDSAAPDINENAPTITTSMTHISAQLTPTDNSVSTLNPIQKSESVPNASDRFHQDGKSIHLFIFQSSYYSGKNSMILFIPSFFISETSVADIGDSKPDTKVIPPPPEYAVDSAAPDINENAPTITTSMTHISAQLTPTDNSVSTLNPIQKSESVPNASDRFHQDVAGASDWLAAGSAVAYGRSTSLYERHPATGVTAGSPIADCFAVVARRNSAVLCLADGVNWGSKACLAARAAVHGCVDYLNHAIFSWPITTTTEVFVALLRSFHAAHNLILQEEGLLTTLTAVIVLPLATPDRYVACACNVGDSLAYVYSPRHGVREITQGSHDLNRMRDMRDALGALGPVDGLNPELGNLTCSMTEVEPGDIVFLTSDGVSDNLDPVVGKFTGLPNVEAHQRHKLSLLRTEDLLRNGVSGHGPPCSTAREVVSLLIDFVTRLTAAKRKMLEDAELYQDNAEGPRGSRGKQRARRREVCAKLAMVPGKLDHATVAAYNVGDLVTEPVS